MNQPPSSPKPTVLVAPLDWGLGHATRCIPVIHTLIRHQCNVILASDGKGKSLLEQEFPHLTSLTLKGYDIRYSRSPFTLPFVLATQIPKIISTIQYENERLKDLVKEYRINAVISDNRYGLYHRDIPTVFITHQLLIKTPFGRQPDQLLQKLNYKYINQFTECWVPDDAHGDSLAGALSHPLIEPAVPVKYIGPLSRFEADTEPLPAQHLLVLLSGPEPQRTMLEELLLRQLANYKGPVVLVRGLPGEAELLSTPTNVTVFNHLPAETLRHTIRSASYVIARCGYSTIMDLAVLQKKSILIPTPGQTEQSYLSQHLMNRRLALCFTQDKFKLLPALALAENFPYQPFATDGHSHLASAVKSLRYKIEFGNFPHA
jgi:uncharacterized protein (TIGR00661 family)